MGVGVVLITNLEVSPDLDWHWGGYHNPNFVDWSRSHTAGWELKPDLGTRALGLEWLLGSQALLSSGF